MKNFSSWLIVGFCWLCVAGVVLAADDEILFNRDIRPILSDKCFRCHGPDSATREADLRLDQEEMAKADRDGNPAIVPGHPEQSSLIQRIFDEEESTRMPPPDSGRTLSDRERTLLRNWIVAGAKWQPHWAFVAPRRPEWPQVSRPDWPQNGIDYFILARLDAEGLSPAAPASKEEWIRRVTLDLTGLPPTIEEVDAFLQDTSSDAFETVVDRLLQSPRYGEQMALTWLDAARYADTDGYQNDGPREMWRWRDWVINAYNAGMPFDQFTIEQLAGDLLPNPTLDQRIATGFNRNHRYNSEAGLVLEEFLLENAVDRVDTTSTVWMGLTMGCGRCHDHKYDPLSQIEYYQLIAFFDKVSESGRAVKFGNSEPWVVAPTADQQIRLDELDRAIQDAVEQLEQAQESIDQEIENRIASISPSTFSKPVVSSGLQHHFSFDAQDERVKPTKGKPALREGLIGRAASLDGQSVFALGKVGNIRDQERSSISFWLKPEDVREGVILSRQKPNTRRPGVAVQLRDGHLQFFIITRWISGVGAVETRKTLTPGEWVHVTLTNDGSQSARGMLIALDGELVPTRILYNTNSNVGGTEKNTILRIGGGVHGPGFQGQIDELRFYNRTLFPDEIRRLAEPTPLTEIAALPSSKRTPAQQDKLRAWYLEHAASADWKRLFTNYQQARAKRRAFWDSLPTSMVMEERSTPQPTHLRIRGVYHQHGPAVTPDVPDVFPPLPEGAPRNRLGFAQWLVSGQHPLTARVAVNRYWQHYFGTGLVKTSEDFGFQGERPSHPELLDWLATEFVRTGWDVKAMQKLIVLSATYRQASHLTAEKRNRDPENRLLSRGPRKRLSAHAIRDQALYVSGLLVEKIGGPSVSPYQPDGLWKEISNMRYRLSQGEDLYRRSLYTIWKRTIAPPSLAILDAAARENCQVTLRRTNTPLQALTLLNEITFVEAARHLGQRMLREGGDEPVAWAFRLLTARHPQPRELQLLRRTLQEFRSHYAQNEKDAQNLIAIGSSPRDPSIPAAELAAYTALANILLNLDEVVTSE